MRADKDMLVGVLSLETRYKGKPKVVLDSIRRAKKLNLDLLVGPEWSLNSDRKDSHSISQPYTPAEAARVLAALCRVTAGSKMLVIPGTLMIGTPSARYVVSTLRGTNIQDVRYRALYNVLPLLSDGRIVYCLNKESDGGSSDFDLRGEFFLAYSQKSRVFSHRGLKYGIEICFDNGRLIDERVKGLDFQVLVSCQKVYAVNAVGEGRYFICSDGQYGGANMWQVKDGSLTKLHVYKEMGNLKLFKVKKPENTNRASVTKQGSYNQSSARGFSKPSKRVPDPVLTERYIRRRHQSRRTEFE